MGLLPGVFEARKGEVCAATVSRTGGGGTVTAVATYRTHPTDEEVRMAESGLQRVREDLARRKKDLQNLEAVKVRI